MTVETRPAVVPARTKTVADVLRHAALLIEERGWKQDDLGDQTGPYCAWGGIAVASGALDLRMDMRSNAIEEEALRFFQMYLGESVPGFNDAPGRTAAEVTAALRAAADAAEGSS